ncbi:MAG TPA: glycosyltransferase [Anaerolineae bacterium]|nr:glycosyltransferase [Anaerolineae bacterium]
MKVCLITGEYPPMQGGVGDYTHELGKALAALGIVVSVITSAKARMQGARSTMQDTGNVHRASCIVHPVIERWDWGCWRRVISIARDVKADILHIQYQAAAYGMHPAINFLPLRLRLTPDRPRTVVTFHDLKVPYLFPKAGRIRWWVVLALARWSDAVIVTNKEDLSKLSSYPLTPNPYLVPIGSNIAPQPPADYDRDAWRTRWGVGPEETLLSYFGFLNESKGGETLIRALGRLVREGHPVRLLMVGGQVGDSDPTNVVYLERVRALIEELGLTDRVSWTGYTPQAEVSANLLASDLCVLPYRDGASFRRGSFMAALAHGLPIVTTEPRTQGREPRLVDGENVALVPPDDPAALAGAIARLMAAPHLRRRLGEGARALARFFSWDRIARQTLQLYQELVSP